MIGKINIEYTIQIWQEGNQFIAHAMPLDVMSSGLTPEKAKKALGEAVHIFLETAADMGTLDEILQESGYEFKDLGFPTNTLLYCFLGKAVGEVVAGCEMHHREEIGESWIEVGMIDRKTEV